MISHQAKLLRDALKEIDAKPISYPYKTKIRVETTRKFIGKNSNGKSCYELGHAVSIVSSLSNTQKEKLKKLLPYSKITEVMDDVYCVQTSE